MTKDVEKFSEEYISKLKDTMDKLDKKKIEQIVDSLMDVYKKDKRVFMFGNGGSAAMASHFAVDLGKGTISGCEPWDKGIMHGKKRFKVFCLNDNIPIMTAWANDSSYDNIFTEQLENLVERGDLVVGVSGSGNSLNVLNAIKLANEKGATTVGLTGYEGGKLKGLAKICLVVPVHSMRMIEDVHLMLEHLITEYIYQKLKEEK
ncbi:TPA: SIS domain-containing protein [archaeon]|uniref:SIS domain-containing protein n=1 Tax=Candidatus Naiadarchaeum limnaeum TaxID=2756139 RepID=A0A832XGZ5_9ARCH|nr:SIS domain-containing protein [Candidatus Naiadarchaeum limnaeum]